jgi:hypothetical protein
MKIENVRSIPGFFVPICVRLGQNSEARTSYEKALALLELVPICVAAAD